MAELDEKTQKHVDRAVKTAKKEQLRSITDAVKGLGDDAKGHEDKAVKTAVVAHHKAVLGAIKEAVAE